MKFQKNFSTYNDNAIIQKKVAIKLAKLISSNYKNLSVKKALELGCGTGIFTREFLKYHSPSSFHLNDYFNTKIYLENLNYSKFLEGDMKTLPYETYDLIISSSSFQWIEDLDAFLKQLSLNTDNLAFSIYIEGNLIEIKEHFDLSLNYKSSKEIRCILDKYFTNVIDYSEEKTLKFNSPLEALRHLKKTGVVLSSKKTSIREIKSYKQSDLTYSIGYFICSK